MTAVLIAPDSFKGSASSWQVARSLAEGWSAQRPGDLLRLVPMADGGEGTLDAVEHAVPGARREQVIVRGPDGEPVTAYWLLLPDGTGVVELASTSGLTLTSRPAPLRADTYGFGQAIAAALDRGVTGLLLAIGGSASTDAGLGALTALGGRFLDGDGAPIAPGNAGLADLAAVDLSDLRPPPPGGVRVLTDVTNPLRGPSGAATVFGPQKGATTDDIGILERNLASIVRHFDADPDAAGAGAAGGTGFGLMVWGATLVPGSAALGDVLGVPAAVRQSDVVITGEGRYDGQSAYGKVPGYIAALAADAHVPALLAAGSVEAPTTGEFLAATALVDIAGNVRDAMSRPETYLREAGRRLAAEWSAPSLRRRTPGLSDGSP